MPVWLPPPAFLLQGDDDPTVSPLDAVAIYSALKQAGTPAELHLFRRGGHGFGIRDAQGPIARWPALCADWLKEIGVLRRRAAAFRSTVNLTALSGRDGLWPG